MSVLWLGLIAAGLSSGRAGVPKPDTVLFGSIALDGKFVAATDTSVVVDVTASDSGAVLASYRMGSSPKAGNLYVVRLRNESGAPVVGLGSVPLGSTVTLSVRDSTGIRDTRSVVLGKRGEFVQVNFGDVDSDGDGMSDSFEKQYFGSATGGNPSADPDGDGRSNRLEAQQGTHPLIADDTMSIAEVTAYTLAWQLGEKWSVEPATIPLEYVTRAGALWRGGEYYVFDNDPKTNAPMWWVNAPRPVKPTSGTTEAFAGDVRGDAKPAGPVDTAMVARAQRVLPDNYQASALLPVGIHVEPVAGTLAFAVEEVPPEGWIVRNISHQGRMDKVNRKIKWGPFYDTEPRELTYELVPLSGTKSAANFSGMASFDGSKLETSGAWTSLPPGIVPHVEITGVRRDVDTIVLELTGQPGRSYVLESSRDLQSWAELGTVVADAAGGLMHRVAMDGPSHYFRARIQ